MDFELTEQHLAIVGIGERFERRQPFAQILDRRAQGGVFGAQIPRAGFIIPRQQHDSTFPKRIGDSYSIEKEG